MRKNIVITALVLFVIGVSVVCVADSEDTKRDEERVVPIQVGAILPLTGPLSSHGEWMQRGIEMAREDIASRTVRSAEIEVSYQDTQCSPTPTTNALQKLINVDNIRAFVGPFCGGPAHAAALQADEHRVVGVVAGINLGKLSPYFISTQELLAREPETMAQFAFEDLGVRNVAIYYFNNEFGVVHRDTFTSEFEKRGGTITHISAIEGFKTQDYRTELTKIKASNPEAVYIAYGGLGPILKQLREIGYEGQVLSVDSSENPDMLRVAGEYAEGLIFAHRSAADGNKTQTQEHFVERYVEKYGEQPGVVAAEAYDALMLLAKAFAVCDETDSECIRASVASTKDYDGASGTFTIDPETYEVDKPIIIKTVKNGKFVPYP